MGFTPIMALIKGGAEYKNKVNLMRMQGELDLKKIRQKSASDALVDAKKTQRTFMAGDVTLTFNDSEAKDGNERMLANTENMFKVLGEGGEENLYKKFVKNAETEGKLHKITGLNTFLKTRVANYAQKNRVTEKVGDVDRFVKYRDITATYDQGLNYGDKFLEEVIGKGYGVSHERWKAKYRGKFPMEAEKIYDAQNKLIVHSHIPFLTEENMRKPEGQYVLKKAQELGKRLNMPYHKVLDRFEVGTGDGAADIKNQESVYRLHDSMKRDIMGDNTNGINNIMEFNNYRLLDKYRKDFSKLGIGQTQFGMLLSSVLDPIYAGDTTPDAYIFDSADTRSQNRKKIAKASLFSDTGITQETINTKLQGANQAGAIATNIIKEIDQSRAEFGVGSQQPFVATLFSKAMGLFGRSGIVAGFATFSADPNMRNTGAKGRITKAYQLNLAKAGGDGRDAITARINLMKFNLAYSMASALQGGTGGRTISDQDVENMMNALKFGMDSPESSLRASLVRVQEIMTDISTIQSMYKQGGRSAAAAYLIEQTNLRFGAEFERSGNIMDYVVASLNPNAAKVSGKGGLTHKPVLQPNGQYKLVPITSTN